MRTTRMDVDKTHSTAFTRIHTAHDVGRQGLGTATCIIVEQQRRVVRFFSEEYHGSCAVLVYQYTSAGLNRARDPKKRMIDLAREG